MKDKVGEVALGGVGECAPSPVLVLIEFRAERFGFVADTSAFVVGGAVVFTVNCLLHG